MVKNISSPKLESYKAGNSPRRCRQHRKCKPTPDNPGWTAKHHRRHFVRHNYHDHANEEDPQQIPLELNGTDPSCGTANSSLTPFPVLLHRMLEGTEHDSQSHIVGWKPHGRAFCVFDSEEFVQQVMPKYFRQSKISSFQRQLNLYGFTRLNAMGRDKGAYYHELFLRGRPNLALRIQRTRVKGTGVRTSSNPKEEPNFYEMSPVGMRKVNKIEMSPVPSGRYIAELSLPDLAARVEEKTEEADFDPLPLFPSLDVIEEENIDCTPLPVVLSQPNVIEDDYTSGVDNLQEMSHFLEDAGLMSNSTSILI